MQAFTDFVISGRAADVVLAFVVVEAMLLWVFAHRLGLLRIVALLLPGAFLVLALRLALTGAPALWIAGALLGALVSHIADMVLRLRGA